MNSETYHIGDFVYFQKSLGGVLGIGQISDLCLHETSSKLLIKPLLRYEDITKGDVSDHRYWVS